MSQPPMMLNSTLPGVVLPLSGSDASSSPASASYSRPRAETTGYLSTLSMSEARLSDIVYQTAYYSRSSPSLVPHSRNSSNASSSFSFPSASSPADSPQSATSVTVPPAFKSAPSVTRTTIRRARTGTSPYPREPHIHSNSDVYSSSSEAEDMHMYSSPYAHPPSSHHAAAQHGLHHHDPYASSSLYNIPPSVTGHIDPMQSIQHHQLHHPQHQQPQQAPGASPSQYGGARAGMHSTDHNLEQLASNVRSATTTSASDRAKQIFVHAWLNANYTPYADGNVPRQGLYSSYRRVCDQYGIPHMNTATLGKAIRLCFPAIKTRRLGVRGNSKYHYCGIRPSNTTEAEWLQDYIRKTNTAGNNNTGGEANLGRANSHSSRGSGAGAGDSDEDDEGDSPDGPHSGNASKRSSLNLDSLKHTGVLPPSLDDKTPTTSSVLAAAQNVAPSSMLGSSSTAGLQSASVRRRSAQPEFSGMQVPTPTSGGQQSPFTPQQPVPPQQLGQPTYSIRHLPSFPKIEEALGNAGSSPQGVAAREVWRWFEDHLDALLESTRALRFDQFELHLRTFWASLTGDHREVVHAPAVAGLMAKADALLYDEILETLRSQILAPIPTPALASLRGLADQMEKVLLLALENYGSTFVEPKVELGARFGHLVLRFLDIYQVTQALATVLQNPKQLADMRRAWSEIDFESVRNQSALVCNCRHEDLIQLLEVDFVALIDGLQRSAEPVRDVMLWADDCCERLMGSSRAEDRSTLSSRSVLIRWGYVTSQIMRDLTIRSDPAFGAFQILKLFLDDWIALNVLRAVALSTNSVAASVEPVIQQQFFTMSPPEFGAGPTGMTAATNPLMDHSQNPSLMTTLNDSPFAQPDTSFSSSSLDGSSSSYAGGSAFGSLDGMNFMDHHSAHGGSGGMVGIGGGDSLLGGSGVGDMGFGDPSSGFDVGSFTSEFVMSSTGTPADSADSGPAKHESPARPSSS